MDFWFLQYELIIQTISSIKLEIVPGKTGKKIEDKQNRNAI